MSRREQQPSSPELLASALTDHAGFVQRLAARLLGDDVAADDVSQETWLAALERPPQDPGTVRGWLSRVTRNLAGQHRRREGRLRRRERRAAKPEATESTAEAELVLGELTEAVLALPELSRTTILQRFYQGLSVAEMAKRDGVSEATVRSRLQRALAKLRGDLDQSAGREECRRGLLVLAAAVPEPSTSFGAAAVLGGVVVSAKSWIAAGVVLLIVAMVFWGTDLWQGGPQEVMDSARSGPEPSASDLGASDLSDGVAAGGAEAASRGGIADEAVGEDLGAGDSRGEGSEEEPPEADDSESPKKGRLTVKVVRELNGEVVPGAHGYVVPWDAALDDRVRSFVTDDRGLAEIEGVHRGQVRVDIVTGGSQTAYFGPELSAAITVQVPHGIRVTGTVVDPEGFPAPGAEVVIPRPLLPERSFVVAVTDAKGTFQLEDVAPGMRVAARHSDHGPSGFVRLEAKPGTAGSFELALSENAAHLRGRVFDPSGRPMLGAEVDVTLGGALPTAVTTNDRGEFDIRGLSVGPARVTVRATSWAAPVQEVELRPGETSELEIRLIPEASVEGVVLDPAEKPVNAAVVRVSVSGQHVQVYSRTDGSYRIRGLLPGVAQLHCEGADTVGTSTSMEIEAGQTARWDPVLSRAEVLEGRILDGRGNARSGWIVEGWRAADSTRWGVAKTSEDGSFELSGWTSQSVRIAVKEPGAENLYPVDVFPHRVEDGAFSLVIDEEDLPRSSIRGVVRKQNGAAPLATILVRNLQFEYSLVAPLDGDATFVASKLPPGRYRVHLQGQDSLQIVLREFDLSAAEELDLGDMLYAPPAHVRIFADSPGESVLFELLDSSQRLVLTGTLETSGTWIRLLPGAYRCVFPDAPSWAAEWFDVDSGGLQQFQVGPR